MSELEQWRLKTRPNVWHHSRGFEPGFESPKFYPQRHSATAPQRHSATAPQRHSATALQHSVMSMGDKSTSTLVLSLTPSCVWSLSVYNNKWTKGQFRTWWRRYICSGIDSKSLFWRVVEYFRVFGARYASTQRENIRVMLQWRLLPVLGYDDA